MGYRYDGLFRVVDAWQEKGHAGFEVWRFRMQTADVSEVIENAETGSGAAPRRASTVLRVVRDTELSRRVKVIHDFRCQVCGIRIEGLAGPYAEAAHIRPLGKPHDGPDELSNLLCLCPNHHVLFDLGGFTIADDLALIGLNGTLLTRPTHEIGLAHLAYNREHYRTRSIVEPNVLPLTESASLQLQIY